uniref:Aquaporin n=1 Tax=Steinernema glaseri TaxID=37863 RepID=A0A1I7ZH76_9BILA
MANCFWLRDAIAHPCPLVTSCVRGHKALKWIVSVFAAQFAAAYVSFYLARTFWRLGVHPLHTELLEADHCDADLTVTIWKGAVVEFLATFSAKAVEYLCKRYHSEDSFLFMLVNCSFSGYACTLGIHLTGMYGNPIVAWACTFNCRGATHKAHLMVYWLSPLIAWWVAEALFGFEEDEYEEYLKEREKLKKINEENEDEEQEEDENGDEEEEEIEDGDTVADAESLVDHEVPLEEKKDL